MFQIHLSPLSWHFSLEKALKLLMRCTAGNICTHTASVWSSLLLISSVRIFVVKVLSDKTATTTWLRSKISSPCVNFVSWLDRKDPFIGMFLLVFSRRGSQVRKLAIGLKWRSKFNQRRFSHISNFVFHFSIYPLCSHSMNVQYWWTEKSVRGRIIQFAQYWFQKLVQRSIIALHDERSDKFVLLQRAPLRKCRSQILDGALLWLFVINTSLL